LPFSDAPAAPTTKQSEGGSLACQILRNHHQGSIRIGSRRQKGQLSRVSRIQQLFLRISLGSVHLYQTRSSTELLPDQVCSRGLTVTTISAVTKEVIVGADPYMTRGRSLPQRPSEFYIVVCEYARSGRITDSIQNYNGS